MPGGKRPARLHLWRSRREFHAKPKLASSVRSPISRCRRRWRRSRSSLVAPKTRPIPPCEASRNRSLVVPSEELKTFTLVPLVADFLRKKKPEVVAETGERLEQRAYALVVENGYAELSTASPYSTTAWPTVAAALPRFLVGRNEQTPERVRGCSTISSILPGAGMNSSPCCARLRAGAVTAGTTCNAGWQAYRLGMVHDRAQSRRKCSPVPIAPKPTGTRCRPVSASGRPRSTCAALRYEMTDDYSAAIAAYREVRGRCLRPGRRPGCRHQLEQSRRCRGARSGDLDGCRA